MRTDLCELFGIDVPIFAFSHCRDVVAAVTNAGGLGVLGALAFSPEQLELELKWIDDNVDGKNYGVDTVTDGILGLGFIAAGPWDFIGHVEVPDTKIDGKVARHIDRDEMVTNTINTFNSLTIQCARCHNHKFDPFTQQHYYSLQAVFAAVDRAERPYDLDPEIEIKRRELENSLANLKMQRKALNDAIKKEGGLARRASIRKPCVPPYDPIPR